MTIEWKEINPDYIISSDGQIGSRKSGGLKILKNQRDDNGYLRTTLYIDGVRIRRLTHQLVAEAFIGPRPTPGHQVNHKNGIKDDNRDTNLEWATASENQLHSYAVLGNSAPRGESSGRAKLTEDTVRQIRSRLAVGESQRKIARDYGVSQPAVSLILNRKNWPWLGREA